MDHASLGSSHISDNAVRDRDGYPFSWTGNGTSVRRLDPDGRWYEVDDKGEG